MQCKACKLRCTLLLCRLTNTVKILTPWPVPHAHTMHWYSLEWVIFVKFSLLIGKIIKIVATR